MLLNAARAASERAQRHLSMWVRDFILYRARSHYIQGDRQRDRERISHLLDQRGILDSRVYECGFEGTVAAGSAFAPVAVVHDEAVLVIFPPLLGIYLFVFFTGLTYVNGSET